jgi:rSAM/selenodomain-associated transferase 1
MPSSPTSSPPSSRPGADARVVVMARYPEPGRVKTRLAAVVGAARASALHEAFVRDLAARLAAAPYAVCWSYDPPSAPFAALVPGARCRPQGGGDLGARMDAAIAGELGDGASAVIVLGADTPHLPLERLDEAAAALAAGADVVLGPAEDGGYYLIGVRGRRPELFAGVPWGGRTVLATTRARAAALGLRTSLLAPLFDVDEASELARLAALIAGGAVRLPRTGALLGVRP